MEERELSTRFLIGLIVAGTALAGILIVSLLNLWTAKGPLEFRYLLRWTPVMWALLILMVFLMVYIPSPWRFGVLASYFILLPVFMYRLSFWRQLIRHVEATESKRSSPDI